MTRRRREIGKQKLKVTAKESVEFFPLEQEMLSGTKSVWADFRGDQIGQSLYYI